MMEILNQLATLPHRGATTEEEKRAADLLKQNLTAQNIPAELESFKASSSYSWEVILFSATMIAGLLISPFLSKLGTAIVLLGFWSYTRHFMGRSTIFTPVIPKKKSQNIVAQIPADPVSDKNIILMAHYDSARASSVFAPNLVKNFRQSFLLNTYVGFFSIIWAYLGEYWGLSLWFRIICIGLSLIHFVNVIIHVHREIVHKFVPGINDNASGVAAIFGIIEEIQKQPLENNNVWIVFTACEEAGIQGAKAFYHQHWPDLPADKTAVINLDNIGSGNLHFVTGEGMLLYYYFDESIVRACEELTKQANYTDIKPLEYRRAYFDTLVFTQHGYPCTTLIALDDEGIIPNWHWYTDTIDNINEKAIDHAVDFTVDLVRLLDRQ
ncbi:M28 family peptidase [bacterium]|nr:M28 family peptidase [bacterium]MBU1063723.1 M28 family peptidase [bacterium]MBU1634464.1 M28 family peptidase [bacterium]MBU1873375.1 M28 family peptidase [bacterium]